MPEVRPVERASPRRQRGAIGLFGILTLLLALVFTALAVDAGRLWYERREVQAVADLAAHEAARGVGCGGTLGDVLAAAQAAAARNGFGGNLATAPNVVEVGWLTTVGGMRQFTATPPPAAAIDPDVVHVVATESVPASLVLGGFFGQQTLISAEATARAEPSHATFSAGSYLLRVQPISDEDVTLLNGLLGGLLGSSLSLDALSYQGLASTDVNLAQLARAHGGVGSVEQLLAADLTVADVIGLTAAAVGQQAAAEAEVTAGLQTLLSAAVNQASVRLGDVLDVSVPASDAAAKVGINVLDLVTTTLFVANGQHLVSLPDLTINLGDLLVVRPSVNIGQPPQIAVGPPGQSAAGQWCAQARTAQLDVRATVQANVLGVAVIDLALAAQLGQGEAHLESLDTAPGATRATIGAMPGIADLSLTDTAGGGPATVKVLGVTAATVGLDLPVQTAGAGALDYEVGHPVADHLPMSRSIAAPVGGSLAAALANPGAVHIEPLPGLPLPVRLALNPILAPLLNTVVSPLLGFIGSALLDPLLKLLGLQMGGLDVTIEDIEYTGGAQLVI